MKFRVFYMRPEFFRDGIMGPNWLREQGKLPDLRELEKTHIALTDKEAPSLSRLYTSMSVGDIAVGEDGIAYMVNRIGWFELGHVPAVSPV